MIHIKWNRKIFIYTESSDRSYTMLAEDQTHTQVWGHISKNKFYAIYKNIYKFYYYPFETFSKNTISFRTYNIRNIWFNATNDHPLIFFLYKKRNTFAMRHPPISYFIYSTSKFDIEYSSIQSHEKPLHRCPCVSTSLHHHGWVPRLSKQNDYFSSCRIKSVINLDERLKSRLTSYWNWSNSFIFVHF